MAKITREQLIKINEKCFNGFRLDLEYYLIHSEKTLVKYVTIKENLKIEFTLRYKKTAAGQEPTLQLRKWSRRDEESLWTSTDWGKEEPTEAGAAARKNVSVLQKLTNNYNIDVLNSLIAKYYPELTEQPEPTPEPTQIDLFDIVIVEDPTPAGDPTAAQQIKDTMQSIKIKSIKEILKKEEPEQEQPQQKEEVTETPAQQVKIVNNSYKENNNIIIELNKNNDLMVSLLNDILKYNYYKIEDVEKCYIEHLPEDRGEYQIVNIIFKDNNKTTMAINKNDYIKFIEEVEQQHQEQGEPEPEKTKAAEEAAEELIKDIPIPEGSNSNKYLNYCKENNISTTKKSIQRHAVKCHLFKYGISYHWHKLAQEKGAATKEELYNIYFSELVNMIQEQDSSAAS